MQYAKRDIKAPFLIPNSFPLQKLQVSTIVHSLVLFLCIVKL